MKKKRIPPSRLRPSLSRAGSKIPMPGVLPVMVDMSHLPVKRTVAYHRLTTGMKDQQINKRDNINATSTKARWSYREGHNTIKTLPDTLEVIALCAKTSCSREFTPNLLALNSQLQGFLNPDKSARKVLLSLRGRVSGFVNLVLHECGPPRARSNGWAGLAVDIQLAVTVRLKFSSSGKAREGTLEDCWPAQLGQEMMRHIGLPLQRAMYMSTSSVHSASDIALLSGRM